MKKRSIIGLSALAFSIFALASCGGTDSSKANTSSTSAGSTTIAESTKASSTATGTSSAAKTSSTTKATSTASSVASSATKQTYNFTCNTISGVYGTAKVTDNNGAQYNYISGSTFTLESYSDGITFEYSNSNTYNVKATASVNGVVKASAVMGNVNSKNEVTFSLPASDITGDVVVDFEETAEEPVFTVGPEKNNSNLSYAYKLTGTSVTDKTIESEFSLEDGYENLVISVTNNSSRYTYEITIYSKDNNLGLGIDSLDPGATADMTIPFNNIKNDLIIKYQSLS